MLLRSSSTPVLRSLLSSFSETPNNSSSSSRRFSSSELQNFYTPEHASSCCSKISYIKPTGPPHHHHGFAASLYNNSSPISPSVSEGFSGNSLVGGFRRAQSEGNLEAVADGVTSNYVDESTFSIPNKKLSRKPNHCSTLEVIPSFTYHNSSINSNEYDEYSEDDYEEEEYYPEEETMENHVNHAFYDSSAGVDNFCFKGGNTTTNYAANGLGHNSGFGRDGTLGMEMYLARGPGVSEFSFAGIGGCHINGGNGGRGQGHSPVTFAGDGADGHGFMMEEHYKNMLDADPNSSLCLRNYAQFLHQTKKDLPSAEEYYSRAILADPTDGEVLCQYAKLVWELYHDSHRARDYFERAVRAAGEDSHVQAAYACFLLETDDEEGPMELPVSSLVQEGVAAYS